MGRRKGDKFGTTISDEDFAEYEGCDKPTWFVSVTSMISVASLYVLGHVRDLFGQLFGKSRYSDSFASPPEVRRAFSSVSDLWYVFTVFPHPHKQRRTFFL